MQDNSRLLFRDLLPLLWRLGIAAAVLLLVALLRTADGSAMVVPAFPLQKYVYAFLTTWLVSLVVLLLVGRHGNARSVAVSLAGSRPAPGWLIAFGALVLPLTWPAALRLAAAHGAPLQALQHVVALCALLSLLLGLIPLRCWKQLLRDAGGPALFATVPALAAVLLMHGLQGLWTRAAAVTFDVVTFLIEPFYPDLLAIPESRTLATHSVAIFIDTTCSGLEGVGLMLAFLIGWLWYLRREYRFPAALLLLPAAALGMFLLNAVRIAVLFAIAASGHADIALAGFHSQAGWIFFNAAVMVLALASRNIRWLQRAEVLSPRAAADPAAAAGTAAYLLPLLALLGSGMLTLAVSGAIDYFYWVRLIAVAVALWMCRRAYRSVAWRGGWWGLAAGAAAFVLWLAAAEWRSGPAPMPAALATLSTWDRSAWILCRVVVSTVAVPIAEELAFRGYLMRRLMDGNFEAVTYGSVRSWALIVSSILFGLSHGALWAPGIAAGLLFGMAAMRSGRLGDAVLAHAVTNVGLAAAVLCFDQWQLW